MTGVRDAIRARLAQTPATLDEIVQACAGFEPAVVREAVQDMRKHKALLAEGDLGKRLYSLRATGRRNREKPPEPPLSPLQLDILATLERRGPLPQEEIRNLLTVASAQRWNAAIQPLVRRGRVRHIRDRMHVQPQAGYSRPGVVWVLACITMLYMLVLVPSCMELQKRMPPPSAPETLA